VEIIYFKRMLGYSCRYYKCFRQTGKEVDPHAPTALTANLSGERGAGGSGTLLTAASRYCGPLSVDLHLQ
jgi:hypothetical protein